MDVIVVKVGKVPGTMVDVVINGGDPRTIATALRLAGISSEGYEIRKNGVIMTDVNASVANGETVLLLNKIKGA